MAFLQSHSQKTACSQPCSLPLPYRTAQQLTCAFFLLLDRPTDSVEQTVAVFCQKIREAGLRSAIVKVYGPVWTTLAKEVVPAVDRSLGLDW